MASVSPPKPWERANTANPASTATFPSATTSATEQPPDLPNKPNSLNSVVNRTASNYSTYPGAAGLGTGAYGSSPYSNFSSPYNRFGGGYGGGYGGYGGGMYGGGMYGGGFGGMYGSGGMYGQPGMMGPGVDPNDPNSLTNVFNQNTQATFQVLENIVQAFGGVAQMMQSTFFATQSSFYAMLSVAEQFSNLRTTLGSILGIFTLMRYFRTLLAKITGRPPPADAASLTPSAFLSFQSGGNPSKKTLPNGQPIPSKKPFLIFLATVIGLPYLMSKLIRSLSAQQQQQQQQQQSQQNSLTLNPSESQRLLDPKSLEFCRVLYDYPPPNHTALTSTSSEELSVKARDLVAVLSKQDPITGAASPDWWQCRTRDRRVGWLPAVYLQPWQQQSQQKQLPQEGASGEGHSRVNTLSSVLNGAHEGEREREKVPVGDWRK